MLNKITLIIIVLLCTVATLAAYAAPEPVTLHHIRSDIDGDTITLYGKVSGSEILGVRVFAMPPDNDSVMEVQVFQCVDYSPRPFEDVFNFNCSITFDPDTYFYVYYVQRIEVLTMSNDWNPIVFGFDPEDDEEHRHYWRGGTEDSGVPAIFFARINRHELPITSPSAKVYVSGVDWDSGVMYSTQQHIEVVPDAGCIVEKVIYRRGDEEWTKVYNETLLHDVSVQTEFEIGVVTDCDSATSTSTNTTVPTSTNTASSTSTNTSMPTPTNTSIQTATPTSNNTPVANQTIIIRQYVPLVLN